MSRKATRKPHGAIYPIFLHNLTGKLVIVVGGGRVGERKLAGLLATGAQVRLISPQATPTLQQLAATGQIEWQARAYQPKDLTGAYLAFAATNQRPVNAEVAAEAKQLGVFCNVADAPDEGDFHLPAVHRQAELTIAVGTGGSSPTQARQVRDQIAAALAAGTADEV
jgi:cobalt-precorrin 5A hydrolase / precorrin-3B C17-methyltransferase